MTQEPDDALLYAREIAMKRLRNREVFAYADYQQAIFQIAEDYRAGQYGSPPGIMYLKLALAEAVQMLDEYANRTVDWDDAPGGDGQWMVRREHRRTVIVRKLKQALQEAMKNDPKARKALKCGDA